MTWRLGRRFALAGTATFVTVIGSFAPFVWVGGDQATGADAVVVLAGDHGERLALGLAMIRDGLAPTLVLAGEPDSDRAEALCRGNVKFEVVCVEPTLDNTRNEARAVGEMATERGWRRVVVVTTQAHVRRSRMLFERCVGGDVRVIGASPPYGGLTQLRVLIHEWLGTAQALTVKRGC